MTFSALHLCGDRKTLNGTPAVSWLAECGFISVDRFRPSRCEKERPQHRTHVVDLSRLKLV
jgi:hypothetical protein